MVIENVRHKCAIKITCTSEDFINNVLQRVRRIEVYRKSQYESATHLIGSFDISDVNDLNFVVYDHYVHNNTSYVYTVTPYLVNGTMGVGTSGEAKCQYQNLFIGNTNEQYIGALNVEYNHVRKFNKNYVQTFYSAYPHAVSNGEASYETGDISGLFLEFDENQCRFKIDNAGQYKRKLMDFLSNKEDKVIKTREGDIWTVQIDGEVTETFNQSYGASMISFAWTQIGGAPQQGISIER